MSGMSGMTVAVLGESVYPAALVDDYQAPAVLFTMGDLSMLNRRRVGIIGTRRCTPYGRDVARMFGRELSEAGIAVVSGLALGIDGAAHEGALRCATSAPVGVVGSGLDVVYPRCHQDLWRNVATRGVLISEAPPGSPPEAWRFPARNRIIAALSEVLVVVESHERGGSRHTVEAATARGVTVMAVPGPIRSPASSGTNQLLREGCAPVCDVDDILMALSLSRRDIEEHSDPRDELEGTDRMVYDAIEWSVTSLHMVIERTGCALGSASAALSRLELAGTIQASPGGWCRVSR